MSVSNRRFNYTTILIFVYYLINPIEKLLMLMLAKKMTRIENVSKLC